MTTPQTKHTPVPESPLETTLAKLDACVHCGLCLPACPTYAVTGSEAESPRGRLYLMKGYLANGGNESANAYTADAIAPHIDQCLGCQACETVCPSGVDYHTVLEATRQALNAEQSFSIWKRNQRWFKRWALQHLLPNPWLLESLTASLLLLQRLGLFRLAGSQFNPIAKLRRLAQLAPDLPAWAGEALKPGQIFRPKHPNGKAVNLFSGCVMNAWFGRIQTATVKALCAQGYTVVIPPEQTCCGALAHHSGHLDIAQPLAEKNLAAFQQTTVNNQPIVATVVNSAGCGSTLQAAPHIAGHHDLWPVPVMDVMAFLAQQPLREGSWVETQRVAYHAACHLHHAQKIQIEPVEVLGSIPGVTLVPLQDTSQCCGSAGTYNAEHPELADEILALKMATINTIDADVLVSGNPGCLLQLAYGLKQANNPMPLAHPVEIIASHYDADVVKSVDQR